jgi:hypothetical protein
MWESDLEGEGMKKEQVKNEEMTRNEWDDKRET